MRCGMNGVNYTMRVNGMEANVLQRVIEARRRELGETTRDAAVATAITVLKSIRANTKIVDPNRMDVTVKQSPNYVVGWKKVGGRRMRCVRIGSDKGAEVSGRSFVDRTGGYVKGETVSVFAVNDICDGCREKSRRYLVLANDMKTAKKCAVERHRKWVRKYAGMARFAMTLAMVKTSTRNSPDRSVSLATGEAKNTVLRNVNATVYHTGFNSGTVDINVRDTLRYAAYALKDGEGYVQQAVQNACNGVIGMINKTMKRKGSIHEPLKIPFPKE